MSTHFCHYVQSSLSNSTLACQYRILAKGARSPRLIFRTRRLIIFCIHTLQSPALHGFVFVFCILYRTIIILNLIVCNMHEHIFLFDISLIIVCFTLIILVQKLLVCYGKLILTYLCERVKLFTICHKILRLSR